MKLKQFFTVQTIGCAAVPTGTVVVLALLLFGAVGGPWAEYEGFDGENNAQNIGQTVGTYLNAIKIRADGDNDLKDSVKTAIKNRCDALKAAHFAQYTMDETYLVIVIAERHSALLHWDQVWARLNGTIGFVGWPATYKPGDPKLANYAKTVEQLLDDIETRFPGNGTIEDFCADRLKSPHETANRNTSWARILLAFEYASDLQTDKSDLVGQELDHPEGKTK